MDFTMFIIGALGAMIGVIDLAFAVGIWDPWVRKDKIAKMFPDWAGTKKLRIWYAIWVVVFCLNAPIYIGVVAAYAVSLADYMYWIGMGIVVVWFWVFFISYMTTLAILKKVGNKRKMSADDNSPESGEF